MHFFRSFFGRIEYFRAVVQLVEHRSPKPSVAGSSPAGPVLFNPYLEELNVKSGTVL